jgi:fermentation-respiration switch protein FrsA (DUF1100 family)
MTLNRRTFMARGSLLAAGGLAMPSLAAWLADQMLKLRPKPRSVLSLPRASEYKVTPGKEITVTFPSLAGGYVALYTQPPGNDGYKRQPIYVAGHEYDQVGFEPVMFPEAKAEWGTVVSAAVFLGEVARTLHLGDVDHPIIFPLAPANVGDGTNIHLTLSLSLA